MKRVAAEVVDWMAPSMGGQLGVRIATRLTERTAARRAARLIEQRVATWAARLTRFDETSDLMRLNAEDSPAGRVRPTLAAALAWAESAAERSAGIVDVTLLDARMAAETGVMAQRAVDREWRIRGAGRTAFVERPTGLRFDLDGVAKGWIADRASQLLDHWPGAVVDADGDLALHADPGVEWLVAIDDPRTAGGEPLATLRVAGDHSWRRRAGVATSGTSVHRWRHPRGRETHHLIDPRTGSPADTDVIQATILAPSAREAEVLAKSAVILGSVSALPFLARTSAQAGVLLLDSGALVGIPGTERWLK